MAKGRKQLRSDINDQRKRATKEIAELLRLIKEYGALVAKEDPCNKLEADLAALVDLKPMEWGDGGTEFAVLAPILLEAIKPLEWGDPGTEFSAVLGAILSVLKPFEWGDPGTEFVALLSALLNAQQARKRLKRAK